jgi:hypothetical protein
MMIRTTSLIRGRVNEITQDVYASPTKNNHQGRTVQGASTNTSVRTLRTLSSSLSSSSLTSSRSAPDTSLQQQQQQQQQDELLLLLLLGHEAHLFPPQQEYQAVLDIFNNHLQPEEREQLTDPQMIIRFYRASKGHIPTAVQQLRLTWQWRRDFQVNALCRATPSDPLGQVLQRENATGKIYVRGYDAQGRALVYMRPARENTHNEHDQMRHLVYNLEKAIACTRRESLERNGGGRGLEKVILLIDYEGWSLTNAPPMSTTKATLHILQHMYPERMYRAFCLHPPFIFRAFWNMVRPFIDPVTKEKIVFVSNKSTQQQLWSLLKDPVNDLETGAGGTLSPNDFNSSTYLQLPWDETYPTVKMTNHRK